MQTIERIHTWANAFPDRIAYRFADSSLTYGALWMAAERLSDRLRASEENRIVLFGEKESEMLIGMLGCLLAGKTYIPLSDDLPRERLNRILDMIAPCKVLSAKDAASVSGAVPIRELLREAPFSEGPSIHSEQPAYIVFTSGSTGIPKGVPISRRNLDHFSDWICRLEPMRLDAPAHVMNQASFSFDLSVADLYYSLCSGHSLFGLPKSASSDPSAIIAFMRTTEIQAAVCTPTFLKLCLLEPSFRANCLPSLQVLYSCGETLETETAAKILDRFPELRLINAYGPTEATSAVCAVEITAEMIATEASLPVGRLSTAACEIALADGEIILKGDSVFSGYFSNEKSGYYLENGINAFRTGDLGSVKDDLLYCKGRRDRQIKWKGYRIELDEIEHTILTVPGVIDCAVIAKRTNQGIVRLIKAFVVLESGFHTEALRKKLREKLPIYMIPKSIVELDSIPISENKKTDRKKLETL